MTARGGPTGAEAPAAGGEGVAASPSMPGPAIELTGVEKNYRGLRPLRIRRLAVAAGDMVVLSGLDDVAAEVLTNLLTGASLPDAGDVRVFGVSTRAIAQAAAWLSFADQFGLVSDRVVLLDRFSVVQNIAVPLTLDLDPLPPDSRLAAGRLGADVGLDEAALPVPLASAPPSTRLRVNLARALALDPRILVLEHPTLALPRADVRRFGRDLARVARRRAVTVLAISGDPEFARAAGGRVFTLQPGTGAVEPGPTRTRLFGRSSR